MNRVERHCSSCVTVYMVRMMHWGSGVSSSYLCVFYAFEEKDRRGEEEERGEGGGGQGQRERKGEEGRGLRVRPGEGEEGCRWEKERKARGEKKVGERSEERRKTNWSRRNKSSNPNIQQNGNN